MGGNLLCIISETPTTGLALVHLLSARSTLLDDCSSVFTVRAAFRGGIFKLIVEDEIPQDLSFYLVKLIGGQLGSVVLQLS